MRDRANINVSGLDFGAIALAMFLVGWMGLTAWNWNSAREACVDLLTEPSSDSKRPTPQDVRECAEDLLGK